METSTEQKRVDQAAYSIRLPKKVYKIRVKEARRGQTKENNYPMDILTVEIIGHPPIEGIDINGLEVKTQIAMTPKSLTFANPSRAAFGLPPLTSQEDIDNSKAEDFIGQEAYAIISTKETPQKNDLTGEALVNPYDGKPIINYRRDVEELIPRPKGMQPS